MSMIGSPRRMSALVVTALVTFVGFATLAGQADRASPGELQALVAEIRALRLSLERTTTHASQAQLLLGRVQLQENRLATLGRQYQDARTRSLDAEMGRSEADGRLQGLTEQLRTATTPELRQALEEGVTQLKLEAGRQQVRAEQLRADEAAALEALTTEQHRWSDFNQRLEALERALAPPGVAPR
jgi:hypothetical protein